jgi:hypothetical protein
MTFVDTVKSKDERTSQEHTSIEVYVPESDALSSAQPIRVRKLDVDGVLARSFKEVKSISPALKQQSFEHGKAK